MANKLVVKNSVVAGRKPATGSGAPGELWCNPVDKIIGTFDAAGAPVEVGVTATKFTAGSIPFADTPGSLSEDNAALFWDKTNKRLGVGTTTPASALDVSGDALINGVTVGKGNGAVANNAVLGAGALRSNTTGSNNTAVGEHSLGGNTDGLKNVGFGSFSLAGNVSGATNTALGFATLQYSTKNNNTAVGAFALQLTKTSADNTAVGFNALQQLNSGDKNTVVGSGAGSSVINASNNTLIGGYTGGPPPVSGSGSNWVVLSDGAGNIRFGADPGGAFWVNGGGTAALPAIHDRVTGGAGTGFWFPAANQIAVSVGGAERVRFKGVSTNIVPRTTAIIKGQATPAQGDIAFSSDAKALVFYDGTAWHKVTSTPL